MKQPATKLFVGYKIYLQSTPRTLYRPAGLIHMLNPLSILPMILIGTLLVRNSSNMPQPWLSPQKLFQLRRISLLNLLSELTQPYGEFTKSL